MRIFHLGPVCVSGENTAAVEIWDPARGEWSPGPSLARPRAGHQLVEVGAGTFLVVGNTRDSTDGLETTWELWRPVR